MDWFQIGQFDRTLELSSTYKHFSGRGNRLAGCLIGGLGLAVASWTGGLPGVSALAQTPAGGLSSDWVDGHASRVRLLAGRNGEKAAGEQQPIVAGVEIALEPEWKTYWKFPGEDGGIPPQFDWSKSKNVADTKVVFPAPKRLISATGESIGYKDGVVLPVIVTPQDASKPVDLSLDVAYGVCREICIRAEASLSLNVPQDATPGVPPEIENALEHAPRADSDTRASDPKLVAHVVVLSGKSPRIVLEVDFGAKPGEGDVFGDAPPGLYLPMPQPDNAKTDKPGVARFVIDLTKTLDLDELKGKTITLTLVGSEGQSETELQLQ